MSLNQLMQFENMDDVQRIQVIGSILMANGAKRIVRYSRGKKSIVNIDYIREGIPYVFIEIINNDKGYHTFNFIDYDIYNELVVNKGYVFRAEQCHDIRKWAIQFGAANVRVHDFVLPYAKAVDHICSNKSVNIRELLRPCTPQENMKNVLRY